MNKSPNSETYVPALGFAPLTRFYDLVVGLTTREKTFKQALIQQADLSPGAKVLDVGCGTGTLALLIEQHTNVAVTGVDGDPAILEIASRKADKLDSTIKFERGLSSDLPYRDDEFDIIVSSLFFHHLNREMKRRTALEMYRTLKPGGAIHIADWGKPDNSLMSSLFYGIQILDGFENTNDNRRGLLPEIFVGAGFSDVLSRETFSTMFGTMTLYSGKKKRRINVAHGRE